jgi:cell division protein FtsI/penicillin-binding protein 2
MRRFELPIAVFLLAVAFLVARLHDVQVVQHDVWATEAANLVRSYQIEPYRRGTIRDRAGRVVVRDQEVYELEFVWRDFRRGHPLGQVAMAWSLALGTPVSLEVALDDLDGMAQALVELTPGELLEFGRGGPLPLDGRVVTPAADEELAARTAGARFQLPGGQGEPAASVVAREVLVRGPAASVLRRRSRAGDLGYYLYRLLDLSPREERMARRFVEDSGLRDRSYLELAAMATGVGTDQVRAALADRLDEGLAHLARLAHELEWAAIAPPRGVTAGDGTGTPSWGDRSEVARLVALVEARRSEVEDDIADALFLAAVGAPPWRYDQTNLARIDLRWLDRLLGWDPNRRYEWLRRRGTEWPAMVRDWVAGHVIARTKLAMAAGTDDAGDALLAAVAHTFRTDAEDWSRRYGAPEDWRRVVDVEGLANLPRVLVAGEALQPDDVRGALAFQTDVRRTSRAAHGDLLVEVLGPSAFEPVAALLNSVLLAKSAAASLLGPEGAADALVKSLAEARQDWDPVDRDAVAALLLGLEVDLQRRITQLFDRLDPSRTVEALALRPERIGRAEETRRYVVRDRGSRPKVLGREPGYELVHLVTRHPRDFAGFHVRPTTRRVRPTDGDKDWNHHPDDVEVAKFLIGKVRHPYLVDLLRQRPSEVELAEMQRKLELPEADREEILELVEAAWHPDERMGGSGIEGWFDRELRGSEGYSEFQGLQDRSTSNRAPIHRPAVDGEDVWLTLDLELQQAAEGLLRQPRLPQDERRDEVWFASPVGAIVLATVDGDVLVAASTPLVPLPSGAEVPNDTDGQRRYAIDRTLRRPRAEPPGSIIKPLFAAYALQAGLVRVDETLAICLAGSPRMGETPKETKKPGWGRVDCASTWGHSNDHRRPLAMEEALMVSCNTYFAALGELKFDGPTMRDALGRFGLGAPTGVRYDPVGRSGLVENSAFRHGSKVAQETGPDTGPMRQLIANGLTYLDVNVVQMARAYAGLATGVLPTMRLVGRIGEQALPLEGTPLGIDETHLAKVRGALRKVITTSGGSGYHKGLDDRTLNFAIAGKTGSADYRLIRKGESTLPGQDDEYMRKHAWFAGFFPYEAPRYVVIVYMHDSSETASHGAVYLASQFLTLPEVQAYVHGSDVHEGGPR